MTAWYKDKEIRFECEPGCSKCCGVQAGEYGYVTFNRQDINRIEPEQLNEIGWLGSLHYGHIRVPITANSPCLFLADVPFGGGPKMCGIHKTKPTSCSAYPFWPSLMKDEKSWHKTAEFCPGIGQGDVIPTKEIDKKLDLAKAYPNLKR